MKFQKLEVARYLQDAALKSGSLSTKTALYVDELRKNEGLSTKRGLYEDGLGE